MRDNEKGGALTEVTLFILLSLYEPRHGYGIMQFIEDKTKGRLVLGAGTLYGALKSLEKKDLITLHTSKNRKKDYIITELGKETVKDDLERIKELLKISEDILVV